MTDFSFFLYSAGDQTQSLVHDRQAFPPLNHTSNPNDNLLQREHTAIETHCDSCTLSMRKYIPESARGLGGDLRDAGPGAGSQLSGKECLSSRLTTWVQFPGSPENEEKN